MPFLASQSNLPEPRAHVDLLFLARALGLSGGQKVVEQLLGLHRPDEFSGFDGLEAAAAERRYGSKDSYRQLLEYNRLDVELMPQLQRFTGTNPSAASQHSRRTCPNQASTCPTISASHAA